nr:hypothetical protein [Deltaproteobacteria bacterium]
MDSNPPRAPEVYERFLGFPKDQDEATRFYKHCKEYIAFPDFPEKGPKKFRLLSVGTGYGRADFPLIRAYIEHYERPHGSHALSFQVDCVDPSKGFQKMLLNALGQDRYQIFSSELSIEDGANNTFQVRGKSRSGKSCIVINGYRRGLSEFLRDDDEGGTLPPFHCIVGILSFQYIKSLKTTFPLLLDKLCESGLIVIGETCSEGAWLSKPPPSIVGPTAKVNRKWFDLWTDWHKVLRRRGINRRLRLFPPHNFWLLRDTLERSGYRSIILPKNSEFTWKKTVGSEVLGEVKALIRNGCWRGYVSSLYLADEELGDNGNRGGGGLKELILTGEWVRGEREDKKKG